MMTIFPIPAFTDNYIWAMYSVSNSGAPTSVVVVDPGDAGPVEKFLETHQLTLGAILITHHHGDHTGGVQTLCKQWSPRVIGSRYSDINGLTERVGEGDTIDLAEQGLPSFAVWHVPGHTLDHIAFVGDSHAFCGDTLFSSGCGRLFEGTATQLHQSLIRLAALPDYVQIYCTHEYTLANLAFAAFIEPDNNAIAAKQFRVAALRAANLPSLPTTIEDELETNPFLRVQTHSIRERLQSLGEPSETDVDTFASLRRIKDSFHA
jgi:hydroxyacylglutathione hydrolase